MPRGMNAPKLWPAEPLKRMRIVSSGRPTAPYLRVTSLPVYSRCRSISPRTFAISPSSVSGSVPTICGLTLPANVPLSSST